MTPETARALEPGTTPGPWEAKSYPYEGMVIWGGDDGLVESDADLALIAAAPDMRATIAEMRWEYGVEDAYGVTAWMVCDYPEGAQDSETEAREYLSTFGPDSIARLVRRPVGDVEVVE